MLCPAIESIENLDRWNVTWMFLDVIDTGSGYGFRQITPSIICSKSSEEFSSGSPECNKRRRRSRTVFVDILVYDLLRRPHQVGCGNCCELISLVGKEPFCYDVSVVSALPPFISSDASAAGGSQRSIWASRIVWFECCFCWRWILPSSSIGYTSKLLDLRLHIPLDCSPVVDHC